MCAPLSLLPPLQGAEEDARRIAEWREGMRALSDLPNVYCKISGPAYILSDWISNAASNATIKSLVREAITLFGVGRCMFASNFPVDL